MAVETVTLEPVKTPSNPPRRRLTQGGRPAAITNEVAERVGERVGVGLKLEDALALEQPEIPLAHWNETLKKRSCIASAYASKKAAGVSILLESMRTAKGGDWLRIAWVLERVHGYITPKQQANVQVNVQTCIGVDNEILRRAKQFISGEMSE